MVQRALSRVQSSKSYQCAPLSCPTSHLPPTHPGLYVAVCVMSVLCSAGGAAIPGGRVVWRLFVETIPLAIVNIFISYMRTLTSGDSLTAAVGPREERVRDGVHRECGVATQGR